MADFERTTMVWVSPDEAFAYLADPLHLPEYVPVMHHAGTDADEGERFIDPASPEAREQVSFLDRKDTEVRNLSHGEQRQLEIVLGLASDPKILLLDEPAAGLSTGESTEMAHFLLKLDPNLAILLIEHDMDVVFDVADEISVLHFGEILETGKPEQIKKSARVQEIYLGTAVTDTPERRHAARSA